MTILHNLTWRAGLVVALLAVVLLTATGACTTSSADQCATGPSGDSDCERVLGVAVGQALCDNGTCRSKGTPQPSSDGGGPDTGVPVVPCTSTDACTTLAGGAPSFCLEPGISQCVPIENDLCKLAPGTTYWKSAPRPIFVGILFNKTALDDGNAFQFYQATNEKTVQLAESLWFDRSNGGLNVGGERRPIVGVYCDIKLDPPTARRAFDHVTKDLGAPAVITETPSDVVSFIDAAKERGTFVYLSEFGADEVAATGKLNGLVYTNGPPIEYSRPMVQYVVSKLETQIRADRKLAATDKIKVAMLGSRDVDASTTAYLDHLKSALVINGALASTQLGTSYLEINTGLGTDTIATSQAVVDFVPDVIVTLEARDFHFWYLPLVEASWPSAKPRPQWVTTESAAFATRYEVSVGGNEELRHRVGGVTFAYDPALDPPFFAFLDAYKFKYAEDDTNSIVTGYDAFNAVAYGIAAALTTPTVQSAHLKGGDLGDALKNRLSSGLKVELIADQIPNALVTLASGQPIDLVGTFSEMDWDPFTGASQNDATPYCVQRMANALSIWSFTDPVYHYKTMAVDPPDGPYDPTSARNCP